MHAFLFVGATRSHRGEVIEQKLAEWGIQPFDRVIIENELSSLGIANVRALIERLKLKPYQSHYSVAIIRDAEKLTHEAQQALLKTLEEPPPHARLLLETANSAPLLPTIVSRCEIVDLGASNEYSSNDLMNCFKTLEHLTRQKSIGQRLKIINDIAKTKEEAPRWVELAIAACRQAMLAQYQLSSMTHQLSAAQASKLLRGLLTARTQISTNVNPRLSLDNLFLSL